VFEATIEDVSRSDAPALVLGRVAWRDPGAPPIRFQIPYTPRLVQANRRYVVRARISSADRLLFTTDMAPPVFGVHGTRADVVLRSVSATAPPPGIAGFGREGLGALPATFMGTLPCADCPGTEHRLLLRDDGTYALDLRYLERGPTGVHSEQGTWTIGPHDTALVLHRENGRILRFAVRNENVIRMLDLEGRPISSDLPYDLVRSRDVADAPLEGSYWQLIRLGDQRVSIAGNARPPYLWLDAKEHRVRGSTGCNSISGPYRADPTSLRLGPLVSTKMACLDGMEAERRFLDALDRARNFRIRGESLELLDDAGVPLAELVRYLE
jgi:heat shock protein HslJ